MTVDVIDGGARAGPTADDHDRALESAVMQAAHGVAGLGIPAPQDGDVFAFFRALNEAIAVLRADVALDRVDAIDRHIDYLARKAGSSAPLILAGTAFSAERQIVIESLGNISDELRKAAAIQRDALPEGIPAEVFALIRAAEAQLDGRCPREKSLFLARTIMEERPEICVEIRMFGGRSVVPVAAALRHNGGGTITGIETWSADAAIEHTTDEKDRLWWSDCDFPGIKNRFFRFLAATELTREVRVIEATSRQAASLFDAIDFLHIDGSHSVVNAAEDVVLYATKVRRGGIIVFDDIDWDSTAPAREILNALCDTVQILTDPAVGHESCAVLRRR
jgi:predicted O-methyltransferase YrrM